MNSHGRQDLQTAFTDVPQFREQCDKDGSVDLMNELLGRFGSSKAESRVS